MKTQIKTMALNGYTAKKEYITRLRNHEGQYLKQEDGSEYKDPLYFFMINLLDVGSRLKGKLNVYFKDDESKKYFRCLENLRSANSSLHLLLSREISEEQRAKHYGFLINRTNRLKSRLIKKIDLQRKNGEDPYSFYLKPTEDCDNLLERIPSEEYFRKNGYFRSEEDRREYYKWYNEPDKVSMWLFY
jgi:hypothetical protein